MKTTKKILALLLVAILAVGVLAACGGGSSNNSSSDDAQAETVSDGADANADTDAADANADTDAADAGEDGDNVLIMATNAAFPPYEYVDGDEIIGIDAEIADAIAKELGMTLKIEDVEFGSIIGGVQSGKFDMGMAGMTVTDERLQSVNFSDSYAKGIQSIVAKEGSAIASVDDLANAEMIGVQQDTTGDIYCTDDFGEDHVTAFKTGADAIQALLTDKIDCVVIDNEPAKSYVEANDGLVVLDTAYAEEDYAICIAKENEDLLNDINEALAKLTEDGTIPAIIEKYIPTN